MLKATESALENLKNPTPAPPTRGDQSVAGLVGHTPLLRLRRMADAHGVSPNVEIYFKAEWFNPSGSVKDRPALSILLAAERSGRLQPGMTLLDSTSGNMGIAYAMLGAARGYRVRLAIPGNASPERLAILRAYGAEILLTDPLEGSDGAIREARRLAEADPTLFYADQYNNPANWQAHYHGTAIEIWDQTGGRVTHFTTGLGTSGTFVGTTRRLKQLNPDIVCISSQPNTPFHGLEGWKHMGSAILPGIYDPNAADGNLEIETEDAHRMARSLARHEGILTGISGAGSILGALAIARELERGVVVTVVPDNGFKYLSDRFWTEAD